MAALESNSNSGSGKRKRSTPRIDMTPMVDLAFLLLTFFVMTTTLNKGYALELLQPAPDSSGRHRDVNAEQVLNLVIGKNNEVYWYMGLPGSEISRTDFSRSGIRKVLLDKKQEVKNLFVFIKASDQSRYQNTVDILDEVSITRIANYSMVNLEAEDRLLIK